MKKSLLALAVLGAFAGAASAQSSVTIYGLLDLGISKGNGGTAPNVGANGESKAWMEKNSNSRLGFQGNEDIGGGLSAQFQIEHRFNPDTGAQTNPASFWHGRSYVQLTSAGMGSVYLGRDYIPAFWPSVKSDPFGYDHVAQFGVMTFAGYGSTSGVREDNTVGIRTANFGGVTAQAAVSLGEGVTNRDEGLNVEYSAGPIYAAVGYDKLAKGPAATDGNSLINLAFHYDFGMVKPMIYYARAKVNGGTDTNKFWMLAATAPLGPGKLKAGYGRLDPAGPSNNQSKFGIGYDYSLSKRTTIFVDAGLARADNLSNNTAYELGIRHTF